MGTNWNPQDELKLKGWNQNLHPPLTASKHPTSVMWKTSRRSSALHHRAAHVPEPRFGEVERGDLVGAGSVRPRYYPMKN